LADEPIRSARITDKVLRLLEAVQSKLSLRSTGSFLVIVTVVKVDLALTLGLINTMVVVVDYLDLE
jgi:hypothetical protein